MGYIEVKGFLADAFKSSGREIMQEAMSKCKITDIDTASRDKKKEFADYILKYHLNYSPQKNRYLYDHLMNSLGIGAMFDLKEYRHIVEDVKHEESIILSSIDAYWATIRHIYSKYEVILNLYWLKGVDAEAHGADKNYVKNVMNKSLAGVEKDAAAAFQQLIEDLDVSKLMKKKKVSVFKIQLFDSASLPDKPIDVDPETKIIIDSINELKKTVDLSIDACKTILSESLEKALVLKLEGADESKFAEDVKSKIVREWEYLKCQEEIIRKKLEDMLRP